MFRVKLVRRIAIHTRRPGPVMLIAAHGYHGAIGWKDRWYIVCRMLQKLLEAPTLTERHQNKSFFLKALCQGKSLLKISLNER